MLDRFTDRARKVMSMAKQEALDLHSNKVGTEHLLLALAKEDEGIAAEALRSLDISYDDIMDTLKEVQTTVPEPSEETEAAKLAFTPLVISVMERSFPCGAREQPDLCVDRAPAHRYRRRGQRNGHGHPHAPGCFVRFYQKAIEKLHRQGPGQEASARRRRCRASRCGPAVL